MDIKHIAHRAACGLRDVKAKRSGLSAAEFILRIEARPDRFATLREREAWILRQISHRLMRRRRVYL